MPPEGRMTHKMRWAFIGVVLTEQSKREAEAERKH
jgi:hypothetical protein